MVQVLHAIEVVEVQEHNLSGMSWQETTDLFKAFSHLKNKNKQNVKESGITFFQGPFMTFINPLKMYL